MREAVASRIDMLFIGVQLRIVFAFYKTLFRPFPNYHISKFSQKNTYFTDISLRAEVKSGGVPSTFGQKGSDVDEQRPCPHSPGTFASFWEPCCSFGRRRLRRVRAGVVHRELVVNYPTPPPSTTRKRSSALRRPSRST
jgi:hypothetical protein